MRQKKTSCDSMKMSIEDELLLLSGETGEVLRTIGQTLACMESVTGGLIMSSLVSLEGASNYFLGGTVAYSVEAKKAHGISENIIEKYGVVSGEVAEEMARKTIDNFNSDWSIATTGYASPENKPVFIGICGPGIIFSEKNCFEGDRNLIRSKAVRRALQLFLDKMKPPLPEAAAGIMLS